MRILAISTVLAALSLAVVAPTASADLPRKPACSNTSDALIESTLGINPIVQSTSKTENTNGVQTLQCDWHGVKGSPTTGPPGGDAFIQYSLYASAKAARKAYQDSLEYNRKSYPPVKRLSGIGDAAFTIGGGGGVLFFLDGTYYITIKYGYPNTVSAASALQSVEALAKKVIEVA